MKFCYLFIFILLGLSGVYIARCQVLSPFATGLTSPVSISHAGDSRLFVVNQRGSVIIVDSAGNVDPEPFLDISERVVYGGERGLLGLAFHPDYPTNGYFYVNYVGEGDTTHISRFSMLPGNPGKADSLSEYKLLAIPQPYQNHKGGNLCFGPDGYLYIGMGDGGSGGDPGNRAQNPMSLLGKMLRIDVDQGNPYSIPVTNPFYSSDSIRNEIWAQGLRNPWKFSFDRLTGDLWIADVGQNQFEEINFQLAGSAGGENYGWRCYEGNQEYNTDKCPPLPFFTFPVFTYSHDGDCSVTGGYVYRGDPSSPYYGRYFFADYCSDRIWTLYNEKGEWIKGYFGQFPANNFSTFGEDYMGELYIAGLTSGVIYRLTGRLAGSSESGSHFDIKVHQHQTFGHRIRLEISHDKPAKTPISVYDARGILHYRAIAEGNTYEFDLGDMSPGIYIITAMSEGRVWARKIMIGR